MTIDDAIDRVRFAYPQVYYACHTRHVRQRTGAAGVSTRDSEILVHLDAQRPTLLKQLAEHMDLAKSTLSEALTTLEQLGYVTKVASDQAQADPREIGVVLTPRGVDAVRASSVLDAERLRAALARLTADELDAVVRGLDALARACRGIAERTDR